MIHDLPTLARAREREIRRAVLDDARRVRRNPRRSVLSALVRRTACRLGTWMVSVGRRLECYDFRMVGETDYIAG